MNNEHELKTYCVFKIDNRIAVNRERSFLACTHVRSMINLIIYNKYIHFRAKFLCVFLLQIMLLIFGLQGMYRHFLQGFFFFFCTKAHLM